MMNIQKRDTDEINLIEEGKKMDINEVIKSNKTINNILDFQI